MKWCFRFCLVGLFVSCSQPSEKASVKKQRPNKHVFEETFASDTAMFNRYDTLSHFIDVSHSLTPTIKVEIEVQPLVDDDSTILKDFFGAMRFTFVHNDTQYVTTYRHKRLQEYDFGFCFDTIMLVGNDSVLKKCSFIVNAGRYGSDNLFYFYIVLNYSGKELLFETYDPCDLATNSRFGYALTCSGLYWLDKKINIPGLEYPTYMTMVDTNMVFVIDGEGANNAMFYDLRKKTFVKRFSFDGIYEALNTYTTIAEWKNPYRLMMLDQSGLIRVFSADMQEWKMRLTDLPEEDLNRDDFNLAYLVRSTELVLLRINENGLPAAWKKE